MAEAAKLNEQELFAQFEAELEREEAARESAIRESEISRRLQAYLSQHEKERLRKEREEERLRERAIETQLVMGVSVSTVKKLYQGKYPLVYLSLPLRVIKLLEEAFNCAGDSAMLSKHCSCLVAAFSHNWSSEKRREALAQLADIPGKRYEVATLLSVIGGGKDIAQMESMVSCWALAWEELRDNKLALVARE